MIRAKVDQIEQLHREAVFCEDWETATYCQMALKGNPLASYWVAMVWRLRL